MNTEIEAKNLVIEAGHRLLEKKLVARTWGNISARINQSEFVITPSGREYDTLTHNDIVVVDVHDCSYTGDIKPSSEKGIHASVYRYREDVNFIIHTHQFFASAVAADGMDTQFAPCAEYALPGTKRLRRNVERCLKNNIETDAILMKSHGAILMGDDEDATFDSAKLLEEKCAQLVKNRIPDVDAVTKINIDLKALNTDYRYVKVQRDPYIDECCTAGLRLRPYVDDFAQIVGFDVKCCVPDISKIEKAVKGRNAVLVKGVGAICFADTKSDVDAVAMITSKNCAAACYARHAKPLGKLDAILQRYVYLNKYSKEKDAY